MAFAQQDHRAIDVTSATASIHIQGKGAMFKMGFGAHHLVLDVNRDGINDLAIAELQQMNHSTRLHIFDGRTLAAKRELQSADARVVLKPSTFWRTDPFLFRSGDFNGDGCGDILAVTVTGDISSPFLILGAPDFFPGAEGERIEKDIRKFASVMIEADLRHELNGGHITYLVDDINQDRKDDIIIGSDADDIRFDNKERLNNVGRISVLLGRESLPPKLSYADADIAIVGGAADDSLGAEVALHVSNDGRGAQAFVAQYDKFFIIPHLERLSGLHRASEIPGVLAFTPGEIEGHYTARLQDVNGDSRPDLLLETVPFSVTFDFTGVEAKYKKYKAGQLYPLLWLMYGRDEMPAGGQPLDSLADFIFSHQAEKGTLTRFVAPVGDIRDLNGNGTPDLIVLERRKPQTPFAPSKDVESVHHFSFDLPVRGKRATLGDKIDFSLEPTALFAGGEIHFANLNGNDQLDIVVTQPYAAVRRSSPAPAQLDNAGRILIFLDKPPTKDLLGGMPQSADLIINGADAKNYLGEFVEFDDVDGDSIDDLIALSPDCKDGAVYVFFAKDLMSRCAR